MLPKYSSSASFRPGALCNVHCIKLHWIALHYITLSCITMHCAVRVHCANCKKKTWARISRQCGKGCQPAKTIQGQALTLYLLFIEQFWNIPGLSSHKLKRLRTYKAHIIHSFELLDPLNGQAPSKVTLNIVIYPHATPHPTHAQALFLAKLSSKMSPFHLIPLRGAQCSYKRSQSSLSAKICIRKGISSWKVWQRSGFWAWVV